MTWRLQMKEFSTVDKSRKASLEQMVWKKD